MLEEALELEVAEYLERSRNQRKLNEEEFRGYRNGYSRERKLLVGSGTIRVKVPRVSDVPSGQEEFESRIVKPYQRRSNSLNELFPKLFIEGLATRDARACSQMPYGRERSTIAINDFPS